MLFNDNSTILGLTGMSGAGKTTACKAFRENGFSVVDCDIVARQIVEVGKPALHELDRNFDDVILPDGNLNRRKIADIIFSDNSQLKLFNSIVYPYILYTVISQVSSYIFEGNKLTLHTESECVLFYPPISSSLEICLSPKPDKSSLKWRATSLPTTGWKPPL